MGLCHSIGELIIGDLPSLKSRSEDRGCDERRASAVLRKCILGGTSEYVKVNYFPSMKNTIYEHSTKGGDSLLDFSLF